MNVANPQQQRLADLPIGNVLAIAPAGCGKTEALAARAHAVLLRCEVAAPRMILALSYSNKAKDNLATRMRKVVGRGWRSHICVTNFHGLAARLVKAHGSVVGVPRDVVLPEDHWLRRCREQFGINYQSGATFDAALRHAKCGPWSDDEVMERLMDYGNGAAIEYERCLRTESRLDHDDLLRHASRLLANPAVARLYQSHFGLVMVDEVQDLSIQQFEIAHAIGMDRVTYAGDPAQAIYGFAGAAPDEVFARIYAALPEVVEFTLSYRSAPAVLTAVNVLARELGTTELECADPERWHDVGEVIYLERGDTKAEADTLLALVMDITAKDPDATIGVVGRRGSRMNEIRRRAGEEELPFEDWAEPTHVPSIVALLNRFVRIATALEGSPDDMLDELERLCREAVDPTDALTLDELASACHRLRELLDQGMALANAVASCKTARASDVPVSPGLHLLTGHRGKGQEFDWVFVIGLEDGHVPDFRNAVDPEELRVLHVMTSRARYGLVFTHSRQTMTRSGWRTTNPSPWLTKLRHVATHVDIE